MSNVQRFGWWIDEHLEDYSWIILVLFSWIFLILGYITGNTNNTVYWWICLATLILYELLLLLYALFWRNIHPEEAARRDGRRMSKFYISGSAPTIVKILLRDRLNEEDPIEVGPDIAKELWVSASTLKMLLNNHPELREEAEITAYGIYEYEYGDDE